MADLPVVAVGRWPPTFASPCSFCAKPLQVSNAGSRVGRHADEDATVAGRAVPCLQWRRIVTARADTSRAFGLNHPW